MGDILERIRHAKTTASNDDWSEMGSDKRRRHVERLDTWDAAHIEIERLRWTLGEIAKHARDESAREMATRVLQNTQESTK